MENLKIFKDLNENLEKLNELENEISMVELAIYQKEKEKTKKNKIEEIKKHIREQAKLYNQKEPKFQDVIEEIDKLIEIKIDSLIQIYDNFYINIFKIMQDAKNNQKIAIANMVILKKGLNNETNIKEIEKIKKREIAYAQKKLNYSVIIEECGARQKWCIEKFKNDIDRIFTDDLNKVELYKENLLNKIKNKILNKIFGKNRYKKLLQDYRDEAIKNIGKKLDSKILDAACLLKAFKKQMLKTKEQIIYAYNKMI